MREYYNSESANIGVTNEGEKSDESGGDGEPPLLKNCVIPMDYSIFIGGPGIDTKEADVDIKPPFLITSPEITSFFIDDVNANIHAAWEKSGYNPLELMVPLKKNSQQDLANLVRARGEANTKSAPVLLQHFEGAYGEMSDQALGFSIAMEISPFIDAIAASQLEKFDPKDSGSHSWEYYNVEAAEGLKQKIKKIKNGGTYQSFWKSNPEFSDILDILKDELLTVSDYQSAKQIFIRLERKSHNAIEKGNSTFYLANNDYYTNNSRKNDQEPTSWDAQGQFWFAPSPEISKIVHNYDMDAKEKIRALFGVEEAPKYEGTNVYGVYGDGTENLSLTSGQANIVEGNVVNLNVLEKYKKNWEITQKIFGDDRSFDEVMGPLTYLTKAHEWAHAMAEITKKKIEAGPVNAGNINTESKLNELEADAPAVHALMQKAIEDAEGDEYLQKGLIMSIAHIYICEVLDTPEDGGDVAAGYGLSAKLILNLLNESGMVKGGKEAMLDRDVSPGTLMVFMDRIKAIHERIQKNENLDDLNNVKETEFVESIISQYPKT